MLALGGMASVLANSEPVSIIKSIAIDTWHFVSSL